MIRKSTTLNKEVFIFNIPPERRNLGKPKPPLKDRILTNIQKEDVIEEKWMHHKCGKNNTLPIGCGYL